MNADLASKIENMRNMPARRAVADCDIHPVPRSFKEDLFPYVEKRWQEHFEQFGAQRRQGLVSGPVYPKGQPDAVRLDAVPAGGGRAGSSLQLMQQQHLDANNVELGVLTVISPHPGNYQNPDLANVFCYAVNEWQRDSWTSQDPRLKASVMISFEDAPRAVAEIERLAGDPNFVQIFLLSRTAKPLGHRDYWPIYEAATRANLPIGIHAFGNSGYPITAGGWPSYYVEEMAGHAQTCQSQLTSLVLSGVFERFSELRVVFIESGFGWVPSLAWRLDRQWRKLKAETPHLKRLPSEYVKDHFWFTTQPMEEAETLRHIRDILDWVGWNRIMYSSDYPHWDFDDPARTLLIGASESERDQLFLKNALTLYGGAQ